MSSAEYGIRKPHPALFDAAASRLDVAASEIWFIGDSLEMDVAGSHAVGMTSIWYNPEGAKAGSFAPDAELRSWSELRVLLERR